MGFIDCLDAVYHESQDHLLKLDSIGDQGQPEGEFDAPT
jgi:hypothetical protein